MDSPRDQDARGYGQGVAEVAIQNRKARRTVSFVVLISVQTVAVLAVIWGVKNQQSMLGLLGMAVGLGALVVWGLGMVHVHQRASRSHRKYRLLGEVAAEVNRAVLLNENEDRIYSTILDYAFLILDNVKHGSVLTFNAEGYLVISASRGFTPEYVRSFRIGLEETWQYRQTGGDISEAMIIRPETIHAAGRKHDEWTFEYQSVMTAPLFVAGKLYGLLNLDSHKKKTFTEEDLELIRWFRAQIEVCLMARDLYRTSLADSRVDGLTRFLSRATFDERFQENLDHADRYGEHFTLGMFDVDGLKQVNDRFGHGAGDHLLKSIAGVLRETARKTDVLGRYGGDEFVAIFRNTSTAAMTERSAQVLRVLREAAPSFQGNTLPASFSYGFAEYPSEGKNFQELVAIADERLYRMKTTRKPS